MTPETTHKQLDADLAALGDALAARLQADDFRERRIAAESLGALGHAAARSVPALVERSITDPVPSVRYALLAALERIGWEPDSAVAAFARLLDHPDQIVQARAAWAIGRVGPAAGDAVAELEHVAADGSRLVDPRWSAIVAIARLGTTCGAAAPTLTRLLSDDPDPDIREAAARALGEIGHGEEVLVTALADEDHLVRESAAVGLETLGTPAPARDALESAALDEWPSVREAAAAALGFEFSPAEGPDVADAVSALLAGLESEDERTRGISTFELGKLGSPAAVVVPGLAALLEADENLDVRWSAAWGLGRMGAAATAAAPALMRTLTLDPDPDVRGQAAWALGRFARRTPAWASTAAAALARSLAEPDSLVREEASAALGTLGAAARQFRAELARAADDPRPLVRRRALAALVKLDSIV